MTRRLARWICEFGAATPSSVTIERTKAILLDTIACALAASADELAQPIIRTLPLMGSGDCSIIGSRRRSSLPGASFCNGALIRLLDFNDTYTGPRQIGHPSDNIGVALAAAELKDRSGKDLLRAIRLGYEIYGRLLDLGDPESPWDHVSVSGLVTAGMAGWLLGQSADQITNALALAAMHSATLGEVRAGKISSAKSIANSAVVHTASLLTLLAGEGMTGPELAIEGRRGYARLTLEGATFTGFFQNGNSDRLLSVGLKQYPCFALAQGPISAAIDLRAKLPRLAAVKRLQVVLADTGAARMRLGDEHGRKPDSSEAADHSIYFLVAVALLDGRFGTDQLRAGRWRDRDVVGVIDCMDATIDPALTPSNGLPCRLEAVLADGHRCIVERACTPGFAANPLSGADVVAKFTQCARGAIDDEAQREVVACVAGIEQLPSIRTLLKHLTPDA
jgi:2-methylcitrate dehydratase